MRDDKLTPKEAAFLVLLLAEGRAISNTEVISEYGFKLDKRHREKLNKLGYIESVKEGREPYLHHLTDSGWARCYEPLNLESPQARAQGAALGALMQAVLRHLERVQLSLADFAVGDADAPLESDDIAEVDDGADLGDRIRHAYDALASRQGEWIGLGPLRAAVPGVDREELDQALRRLEQADDVAIVPESNQKTLSTSDREAALWIGGQHKHFLAIGPR